MIHVAHVDKPSKKLRQKQQVDDEQLIISREIRAGGVRKQFAGYAPHDPEW